VDEFEYCGTVASNGDWYPYQTSSVTRPTSPAYSNISEYDFESVDRSISPVNSEEYFGSYHSSAYTINKNQWYLDKEKIEERHPKFFVKNIDRRKKYEHYESDDWVINEEGDPFIYTEEFARCFVKPIGNKEVLENQVESGENYSTSGSSTNSTSSTEEDTIVGSGQSSSTCSAFNYAYLSGETEPAYLLRKAAHTVNCRDCIGKIKKIGLKELGCTCSRCHEKLAIHSTYIRYSDVKVTIETRKRGTPPTEDNRPCNFPVLGTYISEEDYYQYCKRQRTNSSDEVAYAEV
jgi:hypothetical protein